MSTTLRMADGDIYLDEGTGRGETIQGPDKADQDIADCYLTDYDPTRDWGSEFSLEKLGLLTSSNVKTMLFMRVSEANQRIMSKQANDLNPTSGEMIAAFTRLDVGFDPDTQDAIFVTEATLESGATIQKGGSVVFRPVSLGQVLSPPADIAINIIKG